ncbi:MAG: hypothetical protein JSR96_00495 [Proteobacteria bacterium]|nr:hypothetical protein [Pseudomonadota bacterium]
MLVRPELTALRGNGNAQRHLPDRMGKAVERWRSGASGRTAHQELTKLHNGADLGDLPYLSALFEPGDFATRFSADLIGPLLVELARDPLAQSPLRHSTDSVLTTLTILQRDTTALTLLAIDGAGLDRRPHPHSVCFNPCETWEHVLAGTAQVDRVRVAARLSDRAELVRESCWVAPGALAHRIGSHEAQIYLRVPATHVLIKLQRDSGDCATACEYALKDGALLQQAAARSSDSQHELAASLLARMGRRDAAPLLAAMVEEHASPAMRWQVLRECLALDTAEGFAALCRVAGRADDPLRIPAEALRAQLVATYPQLSEIEPCRA